MTAPLTSEAEGTDPIESPLLLVDRGTESENIVQLAFKDRQVAGREPYAAQFVIDVPIEPDVLLPPDATIVRHANDDHTTTMLARTPIGSVLTTTSTRSTVVSVSASTRACLSNLVEGIRARAPRSKPSDTVPVRTWYSHGGFIQSDSRSIAASQWSDIARNYPAETRGRLDALVDLKQPHHAGKLILWHGPPGTGKTTALRTR